MSTQDLHHIPVRIGRAAGWLGEFAFVVAVMATSLFVALVVLGGIDPLDSPIITATWIGTLVISAVHHVWYQRHREEIQTSHEHQHDRERRGF